MQHNHRPETASDPLPAGRASGRPVILVIDDEAMILSLLRDVLEFEGYTVLLAPNGQAGFACALDAHPDLIVTDLMMPIMDGHALRRQLRADPRTAPIPVIGMSAAYRPAADVTFDAVVAKPFEIPRLLAVIRERLDGIG